MRPIETEDLTIHYNVKTCIHARQCIMRMPGVFDPDARPWIKPKGASSEDIIGAIEACPSGALTYVCKTADGETAPETNTVRTWENGPLEFHGDLHIEGQAPRFRCLLCRCGKTGNPPFCDNSHRDGFAATSVPSFREDRDEDLDQRSGPVEISVRENGPMMVRGNVEIVGNDGRRIARVSKVVLCRCGSSGDKPFCDGSHRKIGFTKQSTADE